MEFGARLRSQIDLSSSISRFGGMPEAQKLDLQGRTNGGPISEDQMKGRSRVSNWASDTNCEMRFVELSGKDLKDLQLHWCWI